jgi:hypothetical protein
MLYGIDERVDDERWGSGGGAQPPPAASCRSLQRVANMTQTLMLGFPFLEALRMRVWFETTYSRARCSVQLYVYHRINAAAGTH